MATQIGWQEMYDWLVSHPSGDATPASIRNYLMGQSWEFLNSYYQKRTAEVRADLAVARRKLDSDPETVKARQDAAAAIAERDRAYQELGWSRLFSTVVNGGYLITDCCANRIELAGLFDPIKDTGGMSPQWLQKIMSEQPALMRRMVWTKYETPQEQSQRSQQTDEATKQVLLDTCRRLNLNYSDGSVALVLQAFPDGVDAFTLEQAISSGQIHIQNAAWDEVEQHTKDLIREHNRKWAALGRTKTISEIKSLSAQEREERESIFTRVSARPAPVAHVEPLPPALTADVLKAASTEKLRLWITRYGRESMNARLENRF